MPNWCECDLTIEGNQNRVEEILEFAKGEESAFDFNRFAPIPPELLEVQSGSDELGYRAKYGSDTEVGNLLTYPWIRSEGVTTREGLLSFLERARPEMMANADRYKANQEKYGFLTWYEWSISHWGTKWNASNVTVGQPEVWGRESTVEICFSTAWSPPLPVIRRASELFPDLRFDLRYFECGMAFNGIYRCKGGEVERDESGPYFGSRGG